MRVLRGTRAPCAAVKDRALRPSGTAPQATALLVRLAAAEAGGGRQETACTRRARRGAGGELACSAFDERAMCRRSDAAQADFG